MQTTIDIAEVSGTTTDMVPLIGLTNGHPKSYESAHFPDNPDEEEMPNRVKRTARFAWTQTVGTAGGVALLPTTFILYLTNALSTGIENIEIVKKNADWLHLAQAVWMLSVLLSMTTLVYFTMFRKNADNVRSLIAPRGRYKAAYKIRKQATEDSQDEQATYIYKSESNHSFFLGNDVGTHHLAVRKIINIDFEFYLGVIRHHLEVLDILKDADVHDQTIRKQIIGNYLIAHILFLKLDFMTFRFDHFAIDLNKDPQLKDNSKYNELLVQELKNINQLPNDKVSIKQQLQQQKDNFEQRDSSMFKKAATIINQRLQQDQQIKQDLAKKGLFHTPSAYRDRFPLSSEVTVNHKLIKQYAKEYNTGSEHTFTINPN